MKNILYACVFAFAASAASADSTIAYTPPEVVADDTEEASNSDAWVVILMAALAFAVAAN